MVFRCSGLFFFCLKTTKILDIIEIINKKIKYLNWQGLEKRDLIYNF